MIEFASGQITGRRVAQEDALDILRLGDPSSGSGPASTPLEKGLVVVVADGMGGHVGGRVASTICARTFLERVRTSSAAWDQRLEEGLMSANEALREETYNHPDLNGMGSTLVGAVIGADGLGWISIGDSSLYHFHDGTLTRLNEDHSFGAYLDQQARDGLMTAEAATNDRRRNHLFYALLGDQLEHFERFSGFRQLVEGDLVLLASDGLKTLSDEHIAAILDRSASSSAEELVAELLAAVESEDRERQDNVSVIAARISRAPREVTLPPRETTLPPRQAAYDEPTILTPPTRPAGGPPPPPSPTAQPGPPPMMQSAPPPFMQAPVAPPVTDKPVLKQSRRLVIVGITLVVVAIIVAAAVGYFRFR